MPLSEAEREILEQMERDLRRDDPGFASSMSSKRGREQTARKIRAHSPRRVATGIVLAIVGLALPLIGISMPHLAITVAFGVAGFALMVIGVLMIVIPTVEINSADLDGGGKPRQGRRNDSFMERQARKWDERRQ